MTAKEYLSQYRRLCQQIMAASNEIEQLRALLNRGVQVLTGMPHGNSGGDWTDTVVKITEIEASMFKSMGEMCRIRSEIETVINDVENVDEQTLLRMRYLNGWSWNKIARMMSYSVDWTWAMHRKALSHIKVNSSQQ